MASGGKRIGSGPKKGSKRPSTLSREDSKEVYRQALAPYADAVALALANKAQAGDVPAIKEYNERYMGKVVDVLELGGDITLKIDV